jgi:hypothetical protein
MYSILCFLIFFFSQYVPKENCDMYRVAGIEVYLYPVKNETSTAVFNDSINYTIKELGNGEFLIEKIIRETKVFAKKFRFTGKVEYRSFRVKKRDITRIETVNVVKRVCILEESDVKPSSN